MPSEMVIVRDSLTFNRQVMSGALTIDSPRPGSILTNRVVSVKSVLYAADLPSGALVEGGAMQSTPARPSRLGSFMDGVARTFAFAPPRRRPLQSQEDRLASAIVRIESAIVTVERQQRD